MKNGEAIKIIQQIMDSVDPEQELLLDLARKSPEQLRIFIEFKTLEIEKALMEIKIVSLCYSKALSEKSGVN